MRQQILYWFRLSPELPLPLFYIISGYLFFAKLDNEREWNDYANVTALKHYVFRLGKLYLIWSIFYLPFNYFVS